MNREGLISVLLASKKHNLPRMRLSHIIKRADVPILRDSTGHPYVNEVELDSALQNHADRLNKHQRVQAARQAKRKQTLVDAPPEGWLNARQIQAFCDLAHTSICRALRARQVPYVELLSRQRYWEPEAAKDAVQRIPKSVIGDRLTAKELATDHRMNRSYVTTLLTQMNVPFITHRNTRYYDPVEADDAIAEYYANHKSYKRQTKRGAA